MVLLIVAMTLAAMSDTILPVYELEEVVVTATRIYQSLKDVPIATTVITRKQIDGTNAKDVGEVIRGVAGVDIKSYGTSGPGSSVSLRGSTSQQVLVLVDGRPINSVSAGSADLSKISLNNVERIEIVRGPTSHLYGANAMGGVVNVITRRLPQRVTTNIYSSYGAFNSPIFGLEHGGKWKNFGYLTTGERKKSDGFRDNSDYESADLSAKLGYDINSVLSARINFLYHDDEFGLPGPVPPEGSSVKYGNTEVTSLFDRFKDRNILSELNIEWKPTRFSNFTFKNYFDHDKLNYITRHDDWWHWTSDTLDEEDEYVTEIIGSNLQYQVNLAKHSVVTGGADVRELNYSAAQRMLDINTEEDTTNKWKPMDTEYGIWIEEQSTILNLLAVTSGVRYDHHSKYGDEVNPNIGMVYSFSNNSAVRTSLGKAYRAPSFNDLYWPTGGNINLKPESGWSFELGLKHSLFNILMFNLSVFTRETENKIAWAPDTAGNWQPQNLNKHSCKGGEFEIKSNFNDKLSMGLTYTYLDAKQTNKEVIYSDWITGEVRQESKTRIAAFTPRHEIGTNLTFKAGTGIQFNLTSRFVSERINYYPNYDNSPVVTMDTRTLKNYLVIDGKLSQTIMRNLKLSIGMNNIFNEDYMEQFGTTFKDQGYPMSPRSYTVGIDFCCNQKIN